MDSEQCQKGIAQMSLVNPFRQLQRYLLGFLFIGTMLPRLVIGPMIIDDAYITFRYVDNISQGHGFVYNPDNRVLGTTTPLWTLMLAPMAFLPVDLAWSSVYLSAFFDSISAILFFLLGIRFGLPAVGLFSGLLFAGVPQSAFFTVSGMETSLYVLLTLLSFYSSYRRKYLLSAFALAGCFLTRPDSLIVIGLILSLFMVTERKLPWTPIVVFLIPVLPWVLFSLLYFGSPIPNSVMVKMKYGAASEGWGNFGLFLDHFAGSPIRKVLMVLFFYGSYVTCSKHRGLFFFWAVFPIYAIALSLSKSDVSPYPWYFVPQLPQFLFFAVAGGYALANSFQRWIPGEFQSNFALQLSYVLTALGVICFSIWNLSRNYQLNLTNIDQREGRYRLIAEWAASNLPENAVIAAREIGTIGFFSDRRILDLNGLVSPETHPFMEQNSNGMIHHLRPDMIVCFDTHFPYNTPGAIPTGVYHRFFVYLKTDFPPYTPRELLSPLQESNP